MSTLVRIQTIDGRIITGISYSVNVTSVPSNLPSLVAAMPGQADMGVFHIQGPNGWEAIPASQVISTQVKPGAPT